MECLRRHPGVQKLENYACSRRVNAQKYSRADLPVGYFHLWVRGLVGGIMGKEKEIYLRDLREAKQFGIKKIYSCMCI